MLVVPGFVATAVPLLFLYLVRRLDLYASGTFQAVVMSFLWGGLAFVLSFFVNNTVLNLVSYTTLVVFAAPIIEEILKSLVLIYHVRQPDFTYFVDGAIYGFAAGTAFAVFENMLYLSNGAGGSASLTLAVSRAFSVSLMHGTSSALVGIALGRFRFGRGSTKLAALLAGWIAAIGFHMLFNYVVTFWQGSWLLATAVFLGIGGVITIVLFIFWGLVEERHWLRETLNLELGVSAGETAVIQEMASLKKLLSPIAQRFGEEKRQQAETFLRLQAQLGLKQKAHDLTADSPLKNQLAKQVADLQTKIAAIRQEVGVYCMVYIRSIIPPETEPLWEQLATTIAEQPQKPAINLWQNLGQKVES